MTDANTPAPPIRAAPRYHSPAVWAAVKAAYLKGETAASVATRFGVGIDALNRRAIKDGWTRKAQREAQGEGPWPDEATPEPEPDPVTAAAAQDADAPGPWGKPGDRLDTRRIDPLIALLEAQCSAGRRIWYETHRAPRDALRQAARLAAQGRGTQARAVLETAKGLIAQMHELQPQDMAGEADRSLDQFATVLRAERWAGFLLACLLTVDDLIESPGMHWHMPFVCRQRADLYGPRIAEADRRAAAGKAWAADVWDAEGALRSEADAEARTLHRYRHEWRRLVDLPNEDAAWAGIEHPASQDWRAPDGD